MARSQKSGKNQKREERKRAEEEARSKQDKKRASQRKHNKRPHFVVHARGGYSRPATPEEVEHILAQRERGAILGPRFARSASAGTSNIDNPVEAAFRRAGFIPGSSEDAIQVALGPASSKGWSSTGGKQKASKKRRAKNKEPQSTKGWLVSTPAVSKTGNQAKPTQSKKGWVTGTASQAGTRRRFSRPNPNMEKDIASIFEDADQEVKEQKERRFHKGRMSPGIDDDDRAKRIRRRRARLREEGREEAPTRAAYAYLLELLPGEMEQLLARSRAFGIQPIKHDSELPESVPFSCGDQIVSVPPEQLPTHLVLDRNGIPQAGRHACEVCGQEARKGHRTCTKHAKTEKWLPPLPELGPVVQALVGEKRADAQGLPQGIWTQIWNETNTAIRQWRYRDGIEAIANKSAVQRKRAQRIKALALKQDRQDQDKQHRDKLETVARLLAEAKPLIKEIEEAIQNIEHPRTLVLKDKLSIVLRRLTLAEHLLGMGEKRKSQKQHVFRKPTKGPAGTGRNREHRDKWHGGRWTPSNNQLHFIKLSDVVSADTTPAAPATPTPAVAPATSTKGWLVAATV